MGLMEVAKDHKSILKSRYRRNQHIASVEQNYRHRSIFIKLSQLQGCQISFLIEKFCESDNYLNGFTVDCSLKD